VVCAKTRPALQGLCIAFQERRVHKRYRALVTGHLEGGGDITTALSGKAAATKWQAPPELQVRSLFSGIITTVDLWPETGRHHQLRKHLAGIGAPILGDKKYHPTAEEATLLRGEGLFLWALELRFDHPVTGAPVCVSIDEPEKFATWRAKEQARWEKLKDAPKVPGKGAAAAADASAAAGGDGGGGGGGGEAVGECGDDAAFVDDDDDGVDDEGIAMSEEEQDDDDL
jgi:RNA pseudouridylate synthase